MVIKPADKGSIMVIKDREQYTKEATKQLQDVAIYKQLEQPIYLESVEVIRRELGLLQEKRFLNRMWRDRMWRDRIHLGLGGYIYCPRFIKKRPLGHFWPFFI